MSSGLRGQTTLECGRGKAQQGSGNCSESCRVQLRFSKPQGVCYSGGFQNASVIYTDREEKKNNKNQAGSQSSVNLFSFFFSFLVASIKGSCWDVFYQLALLFLTEVVLSSWSLPPYTASQTPRHSSGVMQTFLSTFAQAVEQTLQSNTTGGVDSLLPWSFLYSELPRAPLRACSNSILAAGHGKITGA